MSRSNAPVEDWAKVEAVFHEIVPLPHEQQRSAAERLCEGDAWVREQVLRMLDADRKSTLSKLGKIEDDAAALMVGVEETGAPLTPPAAVGTWTVGARVRSTPFAEQFALREGKTEIAHEHFAGSPRRAVLMLFRGDLDHEKLAHALAALVHAGNLVASGRLENGRAYAIGGHAPGLGVVEYCDDSRAGLPERLALAREVCGAVQALHDQGPAHGDICGANAAVHIVGASARATLCWAGVTYALRACVKGVFAADPGDLGSLAPERAKVFAGGSIIESKEAVHAGDVYALGVLLQELTTGTAPYSRSELERAGPTLAWQRIATKTPVSPTAQLRADRERTRRHALARRTRGAGALLSFVRGDVEAVIARATARDPARRYASPVALAADIQRLIERRRVVARPDSIWYRVTHLWKKHPRTATIAALLMACVLLWLAWYAFTPAKIPPSPPRPALQE